MNMLSKRNLSHHSYNADLAQQTVMQIIDAYCPAFLALQQDMRNRAA